MTNLEIIKYLATNNPTRLAELLTDIYCDAYNDGYNDDWGANPNFKKWLFEEASVVDTLYSDGELEEWSKVINNPSIEITYPDHLVIELPYEGKDPNHMWNTDNSFNIISKAIDEIQPLETLVNVDKHSVNIYNGFRKEVCAGCNDPNCLKSMVEIYDCDKFDSWLFEV
jgi:hypothetical protein